MKRALMWTAVAALAIAGLVFPGLARADLNLSLPTGYDAALAVDPTIDAPPTDGSPFAVGGFQGIGAILNNNIAFSAQFDPLGNAFGHVNVTVTSGSVQSPVQIRGDVTCLSIIGSDAAIGYIVTEAASNDLPPGSSNVLAVHDSGLPSGTGDTYAFAGGAPADACPSLVGLASFPIANGNISVHD
jgi:hypothetical protein